MKSRSASRSLAPAVLVLVLAAVSAPAAAALPAGPAGSGAPHSDAGSVVSWLHSMVGYLFGEGANEETGPVGVYEEAKMHLDPDGNSLTAEPSDGRFEKAPTPGTDTLPR